MRFRRAILAADASEHVSKLKYRVQEGEQIREALQQMDIIEGDLEFWPDFSR